MPREVHFDIMPLSDTQRGGQRVQNSGISTLSQKPSGIKYGSKVLQVSLRDAVNPNLSAGPSIAKQTCISFERPCQR